MRPIGLLTGQPRAVPRVLALRAYQEPHITTWRAATERAYPISKSLPPSVLVIDDLPGLHPQPPRSVFSRDVDSLPRRLPVRVLDVQIPSMLEVPLERRGGRAHDLAVLQLPGHGDLVRRCASVSVAVCDAPAGVAEYLGVLRVERRFGRDGVVEGGGTGEVAAEP